MYTVVLAALALVIYSTLFVRAYPAISGQSEDQPVTQQDSPSSTKASSSESSVSTEPEPPKPAYTTYPDSGEKVATVLLDAGHGGFDGGNVADDGTLEKDINLAVTNKVADYLRQFNPNIEVKQIRTDDNVTWASTDTEDLNYRTLQQQEQGADYFISIHSNALPGDPTVSGFVFYVNPDDPVMHDMSNTMKNNLEQISWTDYFSTIDNEKLQVVSMSDVHSMLIELGFMTNPEDLAILTSPEKQDECAQAIAAAISDYIMAHPDAQQYVNPNSDKNHEILTGASGQ